LERKRPEHVLACLRACDAAQKVAGRREHVLDSSAAFSMTPHRVMYVTFSTCTFKRKNPGILAATKTHVDMY